DWSGATCASEDGENTFLQPPSRFASSFIDFSQKTKQLQPQQEQGGGGEVDRRRRHASGPKRAWEEEGPRLDVPARTAKDDGSAPASEDIFSDIANKPPALLKPAGDEDPLPLDYMDPVAITMDSERDGQDQDQRTCDHMGILSPALVKKVNNWVEEGNISQLVRAAENDAILRCSSHYFPTIRNPVSGKVALQGLHDEKEDALRRMVNEGEHWDRWIKKWMLLNPDCRAIFADKGLAPGMASAKVSLTQGYMLMRFLERAGYYVTAATARSATVGFFLPLLNMAFKDVILHILESASPIAAERETSGGGASSFISEDLVGNEAVET
ncbi:unnamed protein product, partial [Amoebophrya sp. A25]